MTILSSRSFRPAVLALLVVIYLPSLSGGWVTDDVMHVRYLQSQSFAHVFGSSDVFGYYRPLAQATLLVNLEVSGLFPFAFRATNLVLELVAVMLAFALAERLLRSRPAANLAALAFALTPKAHPIAVQWVSARPELLMTIFAMLTVLAWMRWADTGRTLWLGAAAVSYFLALASKEPALLLPVVLLFTPGSRPLRQRAAAVAALCVVAVIVFGLRFAADARLPLGDSYYDVWSPLGRDMHNFWNYVGRALPAPAAIAAAVFLSRRAGDNASARSALSGSIAFGVAWFVCVLLPVLPLEARSELYLFAPGFGVCVMAMALLGRHMSDVTSRRTAAAVAVVALVFAGYQAYRAQQTRAVQIFAGRFAEALRQTPVLRDAAGSFTLVMDDSETERLVGGTVGGYLPAVLDVTLGPQHRHGVVAYRGVKTPVTDLVLHCVYRDNAVLLYQ